MEGGDSHALESCGSYAWQYDLPGGHRAGITSGTRARREPRSRSWQNVLGAF